MFTTPHAKFQANQNCKSSLSLTAYVAYAQSRQDSLFSDYRIQSNANNEINILLSPEALLQALKSAQSGSEVVMRLAKKHGHAVLAFDITLALGGGGLNVFANGRRAQLAHDVLIDVLRPADMVKLREPLCPEPDVRCCFPFLVEASVYSGGRYTHFRFCRCTSSFRPSRNFVPSLSTCGPCPT